MSKEGVERKYYRKCDNVQPSVCRGANGGFQCLKCDTAFKGPNPLRRHYVVAHGLSAPALYECQLCNIVTATYCDYNQHINTKKHVKAVNSVSSSRSEAGDAMNLNGTMAGKCFAKAKKKNRKYLVNTVGKTLPNCPG